jgi:predicted double-glycine peptidase
MSPRPLRNAPFFQPRVRHGVQAQQRVDQAVTQRKSGGATPVAQSPRSSWGSDRFEAAPAQVNQRSGGNTTGSLQQRINDAAGRKDWKREAPVIRQTTGYNCGSAVVAMLTRAAGSYGEKHLSDKELIQRVGQGYQRTDGVHVDDMAKMMNDAGLVVDSAALPKSEDVGGYMRERLLDGQKLVAFVDGNSLAGFQGEKASAHWVLVDGIDSNGRFIVKDPALGKAISVDAQSMAASLDRAKRETGSAGFLAVEPRTQFGRDRDHGLLNGITRFTNMTPGTAIGSRGATSIQISS